MRTKDPKKDKESLELLIKLSKELYTSNDPKGVEEKLKAPYKAFFGNQNLACINLKTIKHDDGTKEKKIHFFGKIFDQPVKNSVIADMISSKKQTNDMGSDYIEYLISVNDGCDLYHNEVNDKNIKYFKLISGIAYIKEHLEQEFSDLYDELLTQKGKMPKIDKNDLKKSIRALKLKALLPLIKRCFTQEHEKSDKEYFIDTAVQGFMQSFTQHQESYRVFMPTLSESKDYNDPFSIISQAVYNEKDPSKRMNMRRRVLRSGSDYDKELMATLNHVIRSDNSTGIDMPYLVIADIIQRRNSGVLFPQNQNALTDYLTNLQRNNRLYDSPVEMFKTEAEKLLRSREL